MMRRADFEHIFSSAVGAELNVVLHVNTFVHSQPQTSRLVDSFQRSVAASFNLTAHGVSVSTSNLLWTRGKQVSFVIQYMLQYFRSCDAMCRSHFGRLEIGTDNVNEAASERLLVVSAHWRAARLRAVCANGALNSRTLAPLLVEPPIK
jgi:hypothetical protein